MANNIYLISGGSNNYYLTGTSGTAYTGSGTPWTALATTPIELAMNDTAGSRWTPLAAPAQEIYGGGPPFHYRETLVNKSYSTVTETIPLQIRATTHNNAVTLKQLLSKVLNTAGFSSPCVLAVQPEGSTNVAYYEIYGGDIQEDPLFINEEAGRGIMRVVVTWRRSTFAGTITSGETAISDSVTNTGTGSPDNVIAYNSMSGDFVNEGGQPLNIRLTPSDDNVARIFAASIYSRTYSTTGAGVRSTTSSASFATLVSLGSFDVSNLLGREGLKIRLLLKNHTFGSNLRVRISVKVSQTTIHTSDYTDVSAYGNMIDFGRIPVELIRRSRDITSPTISIDLEGKSTDGLTAAITVVSSELLFYYDFCRIDGPSLSGFYAYLIDTFPEQTGVVCYPYQNPQVLVINSASNAIRSYAEVRGTLPRYFSGASLYLNWVDDVYEHFNTQTMAIEATNAPLWRTFRGSD